MLATIIGAILGTIGSLTISHFYYQRAAWERWLGMVDEVGPIDVAIVNGDLIDGSGAHPHGAAWPAGLPSPAGRALFP